MLKGSSVIILLLAWLSAAFGVVYITRGDIMAYHQRFIGMTLEEIRQINENLGELVLILMNVIGSGLIAFGILVTALVFKGLWKREKWAWWSILIAFSALNVPQIIVTQKIGGTPVLLSIVGFIVFVVAMGAAAAEIFKKQEVCPEAAFEN